MAAECSFCTLWMIATVPEAATVQVRLEALVLEPVTVPGLASAFTFSADPFSPAEYLGAAEQMYSEAYAGKSNWAALVSSSCQHGTLLFLFVDFVSIIFRRN